MKLGHRGHGGDGVTTQLGQLVTRRRVDVDEAVHVADAEALHPVGGRELPLRSETRNRDRGSEPRGRVAKLFGRGGNRSGRLIAF